MEIQNYELYVQRMEKSMVDKLWFAKKIPSEVGAYVDFGCADGAMLSHIHILFPEAKLYGIDANEHMIEQARRKCPFAEFHHRFFNGIPEDSVLVLSSVIHEVFSYGDSNSVSAFWDYVFNTGFRYVAIRDLMVSNFSLRPAEVPLIESIEKYGNKQQLKDYTDIWGDISLQKDAIHFLLKYKYVENWDREVRENYFPITLEHLLNLTPCKYKINFLHHYILPYTKNMIQKDFCTSFPDNTHVKLLLGKCP